MRTSVIAAGVRIATSPDSTTRLDTAAFGCSFQAGWWTMHPCRARCVHWFSPRWPPVVPILPRRSAVLLTTRRTSAIRFRAGVVDVLVGPAGHPWGHRPLSTQRFSRMIQTRCSRPIASLKCPTAELPSRDLDDLCAVPVLSGGSGASSFRRPELGPVHDVALVAFAARIRNRKQLRRMRTAPH
jgi:hypothetical protein